MNESTHTVLVVDDDEGIRKLIRRLLPTSEFHVASAATGAEALAFVASFVPDLVVLDVALPDMNGMDICRFLRADPRLGEVPILQLTGLSDRRTKLEALEAGVDEFITKPFDADEFIARVRTIARLNRYRRINAERQKFEWVVQNSDCGYLIVGGEGRITYANSRAEQYLGATAPDGLLGQSFREIAATRYSWEPAETASVWDSGQSPDGSWFLIQAETEDAPAFWLEVTSTGVPSTGGSGRLVSLRDVTAFHVQNAGIHRFHLMVQHKLRTPLTALLASLELLDDSKSEMSEGAAAIVDLAGRGAERLASEVEDVLRFVAAPVLADKGREIALSEVRELVKRFANEMGIERVGFECPPELVDQELAISPEALEVLFRELLQNAVKFHPAKDPVIAVTITVADSGWVRVAFADDGRTLTPAEIERAWRPYYQGGKCNTGQTPGMGLGLATVSAIIWDCGGSCKLRNRESGPGVVVEVTLPTNSPPLEGGSQFFPTSPQRQEINDVY